MAKMHTSKSTNLRQLDASSFLASPLLEDSAHTPGTSSSEDDRVRGYASDFLTQSLHPSVVQESRAELPATHPVYKKTPTTDQVRSVPSLSAPDQQKANAKYLPALGLNLLSAQIQRWFSSPIDYLDLISQLEAALNGDVPIMSELGKKLRSELAEKWHKCKTLDLSTLATQQAEAVKLGDEFFKLSEDWTLRRSPQAMRRVIEGLLEKCDLYSGSYEHLKGKLINLLLGVLLDSTKSKWRKRMFGSITSEVKTSLKTWLRQHDPDGSMKRNARSWKDAHGKISSKYHLGISKELFVQEKMSEFLYIIIEYVCPAADPQTSIEKLGLRSVRYAAELRFVLQFGMIMGLGVEQVRPPFDVLEDVLTKRRELITIDSEFDSLPLEHLIDPKFPWVLGEKDEKCEASDPGEHPTQVLLCDWGNGPFRWTLPEPENPGQVQDSDTIPITVTEVIIEDSPDLETVFESAWYSKELADQEQPVQDGHSVRTSSTASYAQVFRGRKPETFSNLDYLDVPDASGEGETAREKSSTTVFRETVLGVETPRTL